MRDEESRSVWNSLFSQLQRLEKRKAKPFSGDDRDRKLRVFMRLKRHRMRVGKRS